MRNTKLDNLMPRVYRTKNYKFVRINELPLSLNALRSFELWFSKTGRQRPDPAKNNRWADDAVYLNDYVRWVKFAGLI